MQYDVFISYSRKDTEVANQICKAFDEVGITYFIDRQGISGGFEFPTVLAEAIVNSKIFLYLASKNSYESKFTQAEITFAFNKKERGNILPYIIDGSNLPLSLEFVFSAINWRRIENDPIEPVLIDDLLNLLGKKRKSKQSPQPKKPATSNETSGKAQTPPPTNMHNGHEYVDLGLSVKWATCNVGAVSPEDKGDYFAWGETETKEDYSERTYRHLKNIFGTKYNIDIGKNISGTQYDAVHAKWGGNWRMPTLDEIKELISDCSWQWTELRGIKGYKVTGPNGNSIFLPAAGIHTGEDINIRGAYWSATALYSHYGNCSGYLCFNAGKYECSSDSYRSYGLTLRPVTD